MKIDVLRIHFGPQNDAKMEPKRVPGGSQNGGAVVVVVVVVVALVVDRYCSSRSCSCCCFFDGGSERSARASEASSVREAITAQENVNVALFLVQLWCSLL